MDFQDPLIGKQLGRYKIVEVVGRGGMGAVYKALQAPIDRIVAIKVLPGEFLHRENFMNRFLQEIEVVAKLEHVHILPVYDFGHEEGVPYIVMRYLDGGTVKQRLRYGPLHYDEIVLIISQIGSALDHAHSQNIIHRDVKPSNLILDANGNCFLADFGTAKLRDESMDVSSSGLIGTPAYMAPEQAEQQNITSKTDIYALGVSLFEMLTGHLPYRGKTAFEQIFMHIRDPIPLVREENPNIPVQIEDMIQKSMAKDPADRYDTAAEMIVALHDAVRNTGGWARSREGAPPSADPGGLPIGAGTVPPIYPTVGQSKSTAGEYEEDFVTELVDAESDTPSDFLNQDIAFQNEIEVRRMMFVAESGEAFDVTGNNLLVGREDPATGNFVNIDLTVIDKQKRQFTPACSYPRA